MESWKQAFWTGVGLAVADGVLLFLVVLNAEVDESPSAFGLFLVFLLGLAATILLEVGVIAWGVELGTRHIRAGQPSMVSGPAVGVASAVGLKASAAVKRRPDVDSDAYRPDSTPQSARTCGNCNRTFPNVQGLDKHLADTRGECVKIG